jgi:chromosome segregation ATPase
MFSRTLVSRVSDKPTRPTCMFLQEISLSNFKSFVGKDHSVRLHKGLNCITGPNGAGKSNLLDAILFSLTANSSTLRVSRLIDLIPKASSDKPLKENRDQDDLPSVALKFVSSEGGVMQVVTSLSSDGSRVFRLNGRKVTQKFLADTLKKKGLNASSPTFTMMQVCSIKYYHFGTYILQSLPKFLHDKQTTIVRAFYRKFQPNKSL